MPAGTVSNPQLVYDQVLADAVRSFQRDHGITVDGLVGPETRAQLNISARKRVRQIELNLERWRWLPRKLGPHYLMVNIPAFELALVDGGRPMMEMKVVVGREAWGTPVFSDHLAYIVINPYWNVPASIVRAEIAPQVARDPTYLDRHRFEVLSGWEPPNRRIDPNTIDWLNLGGHLDFRVRRLPGPQNALGRLKFMFPNPFSIYLHDTPTEQLFERADRALSHGCIRLQRPLDLAVRLLEADPAWTRSRLKSAIAAGQRRTVRLPEAIPVYLLYWTAAVEKGRIRFNPDIYDVDRVMSRAFERQRD